MIDKLIELEHNPNSTKIILMDLWNEKMFKFFHGTKLGLDKKFNFALESAPLISEDDDFEGDFTFSDFQLLVQKILNKPDNAKDLLTQAAESANAKEWNLFYRKILLKKVSWISPKQFNQFLTELMQTDVRAKEFLVTSWELPSLYKANRKDLKGEYFIEPLIEGKRAVIFFGKDTLVLDHNGRPIDFHVTIQEEWPLPFVLDGIIVDGIFWATDLIPQIDFDIGVCELPLKERSDILNQMIGFFQEKTPQIKIIEKAEIDIKDTKKLTEIKNDIKNQGFSRCVAKSTNSIYDRKNTQWAMFVL